MKASVFFSILFFVLSFEARAEYVRNQELDAVIVFLHGVLGDSKDAWTATLDQGSSSPESTHEVIWPELLVGDPFFDRYDIYIAEYPTTLQGTFSITELAEYLRLRLEGDKVLRRPEIFFVAHSMGGLVTRALLVAHPEIAEQTKGMYFFGTPTTGSSVADLARIISNNPQFSQMTPIEPGSFLSDQLVLWLSQGFQDLPSYCAYEKRTTYSVLIVPQESALALCNKRPDPIDANHFNIVKPRSTGDQPYIALKSALAETDGNKLKKILIIDSYKRQNVLDGIIELLSSLGGDFIIEQGVVKDSHNVTSLLAKKKPDLVVIHLNAFTQIEDSSDDTEEYPPDQSERNLLNYMERIYDESSDTLFIVFSGAFYKDRVTSQGWLRSIQEKRTYNMGGQLGEQTAPFTEQIIPFGLPHLEVAPHSILIQFRDLVRDILTS